ncbi:malto-oligosyltrehalose trehalohydrolase [Glaciibacter flavus]|uniref:malto-oligosyltrehalose trehalohydrolase n=1 Tax=Orlajensenia flava TaxID=2565934 RepID=UPI003AFF9232
MRPRVWAPLASSVALRVEGASVDLPMQPSEGGWWRADAHLDVGAAYGFVLDGTALDGTEPALPDPRSRRQPDGVHGLSSVFDAHDFEWTDADWPGCELDGSVIYELHIGTFTPDGTLDSAIERLDQLVDLGIDLVEVLPVNDFNGVWNWGYDGVLWYAVHEAYGGPAAYQRFVDAAHARGLGVVQDVVYNHLGPSGNYLPRFGPYLHTQSSNTWGSSVNVEDADVRRYILDNAAMWFEDYHVDGLRLDAVHALVDTSPVHILEDLGAQTDERSAALGRPLTLIAESDLNDPKLITPRPTGYGLTAQWDDDWHHAVHVALTGETSGYYEDFASLGALAKVSTVGFFHDGTFSTFRGRDHGFPVPRDLPTWRFVTFAQDHDQIGNRAAGDRLSQSLSPDRLAVAAVLTLTAPFTPMLFMGEEWGASTPWQFFTSHPEADLGLAVAEGRITEFARMGWDPALVPNPQDPATFQRSKLDWAELDGSEHARLRDLYRTLIALRRERPELTDASFSEVAASYDDDAHWFRLDRGGLSVVANLGTAPIAVECGTASVVLLATDAGGGPETSPRDGTAARVRVDLTAAPNATPTTDGPRRSFSLPPDSAVIIERA